VGVADEFLLAAIQETGNFRASPIIAVSVAQSAKGLIDQIFEFR
jgi:hypothetical protein